VTFQIPDTTPIEPGNYPAVLESVTEDDGKFGKYRRWTFLVEVEDKIVPLTAVTSSNTGPQSKSYQWLTAILGVPPQAGTVLPAPTGKRVMVQIGRNEKNFPTIEHVVTFVSPQTVMDGVPR
jgi:hypothetical protein